MQGDEAVDVSLSEVQRFGSYAERPVVVFTPGSRIPSP